MWKIECTAYYSKITACFTMLLKFHTFMVVFIFIFYFKIYCLPGHFLFVQYADGSKLTSIKKVLILDVYYFEYDVLSLSGGLHKSVFVKKNLLSEKYHYQCGPWLTQLIPTHSRSYPRSAHELSGFYTDGICFCVNSDTLVFEKYLLALH